MTLTHCTAGKPRRFPWRDATIVAAATLISALLFVRLELTETLFDFTRTWEHLQLDELPVTLLVLAAGLTWFGWRRYIEATKQLAAREEAEAKLASLLEEHKRLAQQHVQFQESERKALARELHDELGQYLNAIKTDAVSIQSKGASDAVGLRRGLAAIVSHCDHLQEVLRALIGQLRPVGLDVLGLRAALEHFIERVQERTPERKLVARLEGELDTLDENVGLAIYRLIQEGLTNISRHSGARNVDLRVVRGPLAKQEVIQIHLSDDGRGANLDTKTMGLGLIGMRERVEMLGGELQVIAAPGSGFRIVAHIPARETSNAPLPAALA